MVYFHAFRAVAIVHIVFVFSLFSIVFCQVANAAVQNTLQSPIDISADTLEVEQKTGRALFSGHVQVEHGTIKLASDKLEVFYETRAESAVSESSDISAEAVVDAVSATKAVSVVMDAQTQTQAELIEGVSNPLSDISTTAGFAGRVKDERDSITGGGYLEKIVATGHVTLVAGEDTATGDKIEYQPETQMLEMTGNVVLVRGESVLKGESLTYNLQTKSLKVNGEETTQHPEKGRVKATFSLKEPEKSVQETTGNKASEEKDAGQTTVDASDDVSSSEE